MDENKENESAETTEQKLPFKENLYDRMPLTLKQWDIIIIVLAIAIVVFFVVGALKGNGVL